MKAHCQCSSCRFGLLGTRASTRRSSGCACGKQRSKQPLLGRRSSFVNTHYTANASLLGERYRLLQSRAVRYTDHLANLTANLSGPQATQCQRRGCGGYSPCSSDARSERRKPNRTCFASAGAGVVGLAWCQPNGRSGGAVECIADGELTPCYCSTGA